MQSISCEHSKNTLFLSMESGQRASPNKNAVVQRPVSFDSRKGKAPFSPSPGPQGPPYIYFCLKGKTYFNQVLQCPFSPTFFGRFGSPTKIDYRKRMEDLVNLDQEVMLKIPETDTDRALVEGHFPFGNGCAPNPLLVGGRVGLLQRTT